VFCRIFRGEIPAQEVERTENALAFADLNPQAPSHVLVIPKRHAENLAEFVNTADAAEVHDLLALATKIGASSPNGYRLVTNTGRDATQSVFHLHLHVLGGRPMTWPPG
jgi:histidine triad (HIT) family protein